MSSLRIWTGGRNGFASSAFVAVSRPSRCGIFVYSDETSILTSLQSVRTLVFLIMLVNVLESLRYDGRVLTMGCSQFRNVFSDAINRRNYRSYPHWVFVDFLKEV